MRRRRDSRRVSLPLCEITGANSAGLENRVISKGKSEDRAKSGAGAILSLDTSHFWVAVISRGQHERAPLEAGFLSPGGTEELPPEWRQVSMSGMRPE